MGKYVEVSDMPGRGATSDQLLMLHQRYGFVADRSVGKDVLEVGCGPGFGLGAISKVAKSVTGGDFDLEMVDVARSIYGDRVSIEQFDAQSLPFDDCSFDVVAILEAIYYVRDITAFIRESKRVLRPNGELLIVTVNRDWTLFDPGAYTTQYFSASELTTLLTGEGFDTQIHKAYPETGTGIKATLLGIARRIAVGLHLMPKNAKSKEGLKRLFYGKLEPIPSEVDPAAYPPVALEPALQGGSLTQFKTLFVVARKQ